MCKDMEDMRNKALERGRIVGCDEGHIEEFIEGFAEGRLNTLTDHVRNLRANLGLSDQQIKAALCISDEEWEQIIVRV